MFDVVSLTYRAACVRCISEIKHTFVLMGSPEIFENALK